MTAADWISDRRALIDAATEGPWIAALLDGVDYEDGSSSYRGGIYPGQSPGRPSLFVTNSIDARDAALIADARTSLPKALDALEAVLELHVRSDYRGAFCLHCQSLNVGEWPCPTVAAIAEALGVKS